MTVCGLQTGEHVDRAGSVATAVSLFDCLAIVDGVRFALGDEGGRRADRMTPGLDLHSRADALGRSW
jgi:hypothetical protein